MMDPFTFAMVATQVVAVLTPFFSKVGEAIATKFGEDDYQVSKHLYEVVRDRFANNDDGGRASKALQNFADDPQLYGNVFEGILQPLLQSDPGFADTITQILHTGPIQRIVVGEDAKVTNTQMNNEYGQAFQTIEGGD